MLSKFFTSFWGVWNSETLSRLKIRRPSWIEVRWVSIYWYKFLVMLSRMLDLYIPELSLRLSIHANNNRRTLNLGAISPPVNKIRLASGDELSSENSSKRQNEDLIKLVMSLKQRFLVGRSFLSSFQTCLKRSFARQRGASSRSSSWFRVSHASQSARCRTAWWVDEGEKTFQRSRRENQSVHGLIWVNCLIWEI